MTTHSRPSSTAASPDRRTTYRRLVLAAARGDSLQDVAAIGLAGACTVSGWPVGQLSVIDMSHGPRVVTVAATFGADTRPDLATALTGAMLEPGSPATTAATTGRPCWSDPDAGDAVARLAVPLTHGDVVGVLELIDDPPAVVDDPLVDTLAETAEVLGAVVARAQAADESLGGWHAGPPGPAAKPDDIDDLQGADAARAVQDRLELDQRRLAEAEVIGSFGVWELVPGRPFAWSPELCRIHGVPPDFIPTLAHNLAFVHPDDLPAVDAYIARMRADQASPPVQYRIRQPGGDVRWVESHVKVLDGNRIIGITRDITDQRAREQRDRLQSQIAQTMVEGVTLVRADGTILYVNPQFATMFGYRPDEMEGRSIWDFNAEEYRPPPGTITDPQPGGFHGELRHLRHDGSVFITDANVTAMPIDDGDPGELAWLAVERDITEEKKQSEALRDSEARLALIQENAPIGLALVNRDGRFVQPNPALCAITGRSADELQQLTFRDITHPDDVDDSQRLYQRLVDGELSSCEMEKRYVRPDGTAVWVDLTVAFAQDNNGAPRHVIIQVVDIGARKAAEEARARHAEELERSNAELRRATEEAERAQLAAVEANRAKNEFLSRMSHELRTPLNAVLGFTQLLGMEELGTTQLDMVDQVLRGGRHLLVLIDEVLDIARMENGTMSVVVEPVDVAAAIDHARSLLDPLVRERGVRVDTLATDDGTVPSAGADRRRVVQILLNLLSNAVKYNKPDGEVTVSAEQVDDRLCISVADTGRGIAPEVLPRVFEPFDRLGAEQTGVEGTGIGLTVSRALAEQMGGRLTVRSALGKGSTFTLELPVFKGAETPVV
jgi:PAS domain S-box-containing protein